MKKNLIVIKRAQFGYHIDTLYFCLYLKSRYEIVYVCYDYGQPRRIENGISVRYVERRGSKVHRYWRFLAIACRHIKKCDGIVQLGYFPGCSLLRLFNNNKRLILDIRSGSVSKRMVVRFLWNKLIRIEACLFKNVTVISRSLSRALKLPETKSHILPVGADIISSKNRTFDSLRLLYVGTLHQRKVDQTIIGLHFFIRDEKFGVSCRYRILGTGYGNEVVALKDLVHRLGLSGIVEVLGYVPHDKLREYFEDSNIGVSYIPMTEWYAVQPATKTFEYLLSGMPVIATNTYENRRVVNAKNGVLIQSDSKNFCEGLRRIWERRHDFDSDRIRREARPYMWESIVKENLECYLQEVMD